MEYIAIFYITIHINNQATGDGIVYMETTVGVNCNDMGESSRIAATEVMARMVKEILQEAMLHNSLDCIPTIKFRSALSQQHGKISMTHNIDLDRFRFIRRENLSVMPVDRQPLIYTEPQTA